MEEEGVPAESISNIDLDLELRHRNVVVNRPLYSEDEFRKDFKVRERQKASVPDKVKSWVKPGDINKKSVKKFFFGLIPILAWLPKYGLRKQLLPDVISGFTVGVYRLPQGMAHAILATVPPVYGLYTVFFPVIVYALFGTSKHISIGSFAVVSIMTGDAADKVIEQISKDRDLTEAEEQEARIQAVTSLALMVGVIQIVLGILHFGIISDYLPEPLIRGFTTGAGVTVFTSQFNKMFGVPVGDVSGPLSILRQYIPFFGDLRYCNTTEIIVSICSILLMVVIKEVQEKFKTKYTVFKYPIPIELAVIVLGTLVSYFMDLNGKFGVAIVGDVPTGLPGPSFPSFEYVPYLISDAFVIAIVTFTIAVSMAYIFGKKHNYEIGANQELFAYGASNFVGSLFQCFPNTASLSRSLVQEVSGCTSQISSLVSAVLILITLLWLGPLFQTLPECCLAAIIVVALRGMFRQCKDLKILWKYSKTDFIIWIITFLAVITFGLDIGLLTGVAFSIFTVVVRTQRPPCFVMGCIPETDIYKDVKQFAIVKEVPGIKIFRIQAPFYFSNARYIKDLLYRKTEVSPPKILIQRAKLAKRTEAAAAKAKEAYANEVDTDIEDGKVATAEEVQAPSLNIQVDTDIEDGKVSTAEEVQAPSLNIQVDTDIEDGKVPTAEEVQAPSLNIQVDTDMENGKIPTAEEVVTTISKTNLEPEPVEVHTVILDFGTVSFIDTVGMNTMKTIITEYDSINVNVLVANVRGSVLETLRKSGVMDTIGLDKMFVTVHDAVLHSSPSLRQQHSPLHKTTTNGVAPVAADAMEAILHDGIDVFEQHTKM